MEPIEVFEAKPSVNAPEPETTKPENTAPPQEGKLTAIKVEVDGEWKTLNPKNVTHMLEAMRFCQNVPPEILMLFPSELVAQWVRTTVQRLLAAQVANGPESAQSN